MAGKSNKGRNRKGSSGSSSTDIGSNVTANELVAAPDVSKANSNGLCSSIDGFDMKNGKNSEKTNSADEMKQGDLHLYPINVKTQSGENLELQLNPGDSVMDIRQFLLDAPETCFFTCYDLLLHVKDGSVYQLEDFQEISDVADITTGGCSLEMVPATYDDRSIRAHVHRARELFSLSTTQSLSTSIALEFEASKEKNSDSVVNGSSETEEFDELGFMENIPETLGELHFCPSKQIKCVESITFSSFNPPPKYRRLVGDLIYLDVELLEGSRYCITGTAKTFYVNSSTNNILDPRPHKASYDSSTLIGLLQKISPKFKKEFREILEQKASAHPFENVQSLLPPNSWLGVHPVPDHKRDAARAENALPLTYGSELIGMQRDWNEELQACREFPRTSPQERILRDRALYKVTSDFVDAAINGAVGVINRCITPINPADPECFHMYVHNNIFFSFAVDADVEQLSKKQTPNTSLKADNCPTVTGNGSVDIPVVESWNVNGNAIDKTEILVENGGHDSGEKLNVETQVAESEQATYASANNDLKGTKAYQEVGVTGLYNLAMAIIDYRGHRVVAQSVLPGILQGDKSDSLLYGSVDNGKKICWNEGFHSKVLEAAKKLHIKEHSVVDSSGNVFKLAAPVECKGIVGSDDRHYLLDLMRVTPRDANFMGPGSRFCVLRPELISAFCQAGKSENVLNKGKPNDESQANNGFVKEKDVQDPERVDEAAKEINSSNTTNEMLFNPNVFTEFKLAGDPEEMANDEMNVKKASSYLVDVVLPKFIQDLCTLEVSPMDGQTLTEALHAHGINVRYIGKVTEGTKHLPHLWDLCSNEIVVRSAKHIFKEILRETEDHEIGPAISHLLNCFFGTCQPLSKSCGNSLIQKSPKKDLPGRHSPSKHRRSKPSTQKSQSSYLTLSSDRLWSEIREFSKIKYQFDLPDDTLARVKKVSVLRNLCLKVGITVAAHKYDLNSSKPFQTSDILDLLPVVKHSVPVCSDAKELIESGKAQLAECMLNEAYVSFSEAFSILQQVTGPMHREVANCCRYLAMVLYHANDMAGAIIQQHKELIINERCLGLDHPDTAHSYSNMALFYHGLNRTKLALRHMSRALLLLGLSSGPDHPDVAATFINVAMMYQDAKKLNIALRYFQEALTKNEKLLGPDHIQTAVCYHALAIAFNCLGLFKLSEQHETKSYHILVKQLGEDDSRTRDALNWIETFKLREQQKIAEKQKGQALNAASAQKAIDILKANPDLMQAFQAASGAGGSRISAGKFMNAALIGENLPRGKGIDERAARAAAEVRKKAAAKGLSIRPRQQGVSAAQPPLTQLLNMINTAGSSSGAQHGESGDVKAAERRSPNESEAAAPVGLGKGLSLDNKKHKLKAKTVA